MFSQDKCLGLATPSPERQCPESGRRRGRTPAAAATEAGCPPEKRDSRISQGLLIPNQGTSSSLKGLQHSIPRSHGHSASLQLFPPGRPRPGSARPPPTSLATAPLKGSNILSAHASPRSGESVAGPGGPSPPAPWRHPRRASLWPMYPQTFKLSKAWEDCVFTHTHTPQILCALKLNLSRISNCQILPI